MGICFNPFFPNIRHGTENNRYSVELKKHNLFTIKKKIVTLQTQNAG